MMKKILLFITMLFAMVPVLVNAVELPEKTNHEKVTIYIFRGHGCGHCHEALEYFYNNKDTYGDYFDVVTYEVWKNSENSEFMKTVANSFGDSVNGVPYIVIGASYTNTNGFGDSNAEEIVTAALEAYADEEYHDVVKELAKENDKIESKDLEESCREEGIIAGKYDAVIIITILIVVLGGGFLLIKLARN